MQDGLAYLFYVSGLRHVPASIGAASFYLIPVHGLAAATMIGESLGPTQWLGAAVLVLAVGAIALRTARANLGTRSPSPASATD